MPVKPPRPPSPPLTALRSFEAAARLNGFTRAADELCVTPGAIAQQVKQLEQWAGAPLFERQAQGVVLTEAGGMVLPAMTQAFDQIGEAVRQLRQATSPNRIQLAALPSVAQLWLSPRLPALRTAMPDLVLSVTAMETPPNLGREPFDLSLFFMEEGGAAIAQDVLFPVCSPDLAAKVDSIDDLNVLPCLHDATWAEDWGLWLSSFGADHITPRGPVHSLYALAVDDALNGAGILMGHGPLVARHLQSGALVAPFTYRLSRPAHLGIETRAGILPAPLKELVDLLSGKSRL
ncbi:transcriptional regulator, LysR family [Shimia gijangensis]|uniref:Transcriptional regulator, LysR family n=1 Tax=Shimia gijangensis TaxID=1470563 RepID=A0A1M6FM46_9RHOB|nr:LysR family transcriptional regulator [Shimia gijangensis]SHI98736.1 transcriptional regulator, LysR family [Shimia gijangensis]